MISKALKTIYTYNMLHENDSVIIGLSGGADSISLLNVLLHLKIFYNLKITAVHINHCLRGDESDSDESFVSSICNELGIKLIVFKLDINLYAKNNNLTSEEAGRKLRYDSFYDVLKKEKANKIAVAHNKNDQAETILMRISRGTGMKGLCGIPYVRDEIIRPLLDCSRDDIENYCLSNNIAYKTDSTNSLEIYTRNKIRLNFIPLIKKELNTNIVDTLCRMSKIINDENDYLEKISLEAFSVCAENANTVLINIEKLLKYDDVIKRRIIRLACLRYTKDLHDINYEHVSNILSLLYKNNGKRITIPNNLVAIRQYDFISIFVQEEISKDFCYDLKLDEYIFIEEINKYISLSENILKNTKKLTNIYTKSFCCDRINNVVQVRNRKTGDKIHLKGMSGTKKIKDLFIDLKIPQSERDKIPLVADGQNIIWILDNINRVSVDYDTDLNSNKKVFIQLWEAIK